MSSLFDIPYEALLITHSDGVITVSLPMSIFASWQHTHFCAYGLTAKYKKKSVSACLNNAAAIVHFYLSQPGCVMDDVSCEMPMDRGTNLMPPLTCQKGERVCAL